MYVAGCLPRFGLAHLDPAERAHLNRVWHRLNAWPDTVAGLTRLKSRFTICTLSNGNIGLLTDMRAGLPGNAAVWERVMRRLAEASGEAVTPTMEEMFRRMEAGEDPESVEEEMGDALAEDPLSRAGDGIGRLRRRYLPPSVDSTLYEM